jgi:protein-tyrosine kinase
VELIKEAVKKAKASAPPGEAGDRFTRPSPAPSTAPPLAKAPAASPPNIPEVEPDVSRLERQRLVSFAMKDPSHIAFNVLRTKVFKTLRDNGWKSLALTSPTSGCGKTMVAINLAFSLARQPSCRTVLIDLDLKKSGVARSLGVNAADSIGRYLEGNADLSDCFVRIGESLFLGLNHHTVKNPAELMHHDKAKTMLRRLTETLAPDVVLFDLPPLLATDEAIAFVPHVDASMLVVAAGETTAPQVTECERILRENGSFLGAILNKASGDSTKDYYDSH